MHVSWVRDEGDRRMSYQDHEVEVSAVRASHQAYNEIIINDVIRKMYDQYNIELFSTSCNSSMISSQSKSVDELNKELVNAIAIEKAKSKLKGV